MYAVVGCNACSQLWILEGEPETTGCPRCGKRHVAERLTKFVETDDEDLARDVRASLLASRSGHADAFSSVPSFGELDADVNRPVLEDGEYLGGIGVDVDAVEAAGDAATTAPRSRSRRDTVLAALTNLDVPTEPEVVAYASDRGVPADYTRRTLEKLVRRGAVSENRGRYRLL